MRSLPHSLLPTLNARPRLCLRHPTPEAQMKIKQTIRKTIFATLWHSLFLLLLGMLLTVPAHGQIYVSDNTNGTVGEYNLDAKPINTSFISGLAQPAGLALSGNYLYV